MKYRSTLLVLFIVICTKLYAIEPASISIRIGDGYDGTEVWIGVVPLDEESSFTEWVSSAESEFSIEIFDTKTVETLVVLKKNAVPFVLPITPKMIKEGLTIEFSEGHTISGTVVAIRDGLPITDGVVSLQFDETIGVRLPDAQSIFTWKLDEEGAFDIHGVPFGEHTVSVVAEGFISAAELITVSDPETPRELKFFLPKAVFIRGRIIDYDEANQSVTTLRVAPTVRGSIEVLSSDPRDQRNEIRTKFDKDNNFQIGPFAEDSVVELVARIPDGQRSQIVKVTAPNDEAELFVFRWVRVSGTVLDHATKSPVEKYTVTTTSNHLHRFEIDDPDGSFSEEFGEFAGDVSIEASGYLFWSKVYMFRELEDVEEFELGTIELVRAHTVRGRVIERATGNPIVDASIRRTDGGGPGIDAHTNWILRYNLNHVTTTTDENGEFELTGFPLQDGSIYAYATGFAGATRTVDDPEEFLEFELDPIGSISGQVVSLDGEPVAAWINFPGGGTRTEDGNFHFNVGAGTHRYRAVADSGRSQIVEIETEVGETVEGIRIVIDIVGRVYGEIEGLVKDEWIVVSAGGANKYIYDNGPYEFFGATTGSHEFRGKTSLGRELTGTITIGDTLEARFDLDFPSAASLSGRVTAGTEGFGEYEIVARPKNENLPSARTRTESDGTFKFEAMAPGTYEVEIPSRAFTRWVYVDGATSVDFDVGANSLTGTVHGTSSLREVSVLLKGGPLGRKMTTWSRVKADGSYLFHGLPSGTYSVQVSHSDLQEETHEVEIDQDVVYFDIYPHEALNEE